MRRVRSRAWSRTSLPLTLTLALTPEPEPGAQATMVKDLKAYGYTDVQVGKHYNDSTY